MKASKVPDERKRQAGPRVRGDLYAPACPSRGVLDHVTSRWGVLVLVALRERTHRFSELRRRVGGVSEKMLSQTLKALEADGFIARAVFPEIPPRVEYSLTSMGSEAADRVQELTDWIERNLGRILAARDAVSGARAHAAPRSGRATGAPAS